MTENKPTPAMDIIRQMAERVDEYHRKLEAQDDGRSYREWEKRRLIERIGLLEAWKEAATLNYRNMEAALTERDATIAAAPHAEDCRSWGWNNQGIPPYECTCWKSAAPGDAHKTGETE